MSFRVDGLAVGLIAAGAVFYVAIAWTVRPGFYDCCAAPQYAYVSPPAVLASTNVQPTSGSGELAVRGGVVDGGLVSTRDQPQPQAKLFFAPGDLVPPTDGGAVGIQVIPYAPPAQTSDVTLEGNVYCVTANSAFTPGRHPMIALSVPPYGPFATTMYYASARAGSWAAIGGAFDLNDYQVTASMHAFGCFAVGYPTQAPGGQPRLGGALLPVVTAAAIALVLLSGIPLAILRRRRGRQ